MRRCYTSDMSLLPIAIIAPAAKTVVSRRVALVYAAILTVMAVAQLYSFDDFLVLAKTFGDISGVGGAYLVAAFLVTSEVLAIPFLLRMSLSPAFRWVSMVLGWIVAATWLKVTIWLALQSAGTGNVGFLGTVVTVTPGWWAVLISVLLAVLSGWSAWGLWPRGMIKILTRSVHGTDQ